jgi:hypothetical protein
MKIVRIEVLPASDGDVVAALVVLQKQSGSAWTEVERHVVLSSEHRGARQLLLEEDERVVVDGRTQVELVMDKEQNAVVTRPKAGVITPLLEQQLPPGPLPPGTESQIGVWREGGEQDWSRTGKRYRNY